jgi:NAD+ kinase
MANPTSSTTGSTPPSAKPVQRLAVLVHSHAETGAALRQVEGMARDAGVELVLVRGDDAQDPDELSAVDLMLVLGGDGTMLRGLRRLVGTDVPVIGVNFGRVGFLTAIAEDELAVRLPQVFAGAYRVIELPTLELALDGEQRFAVNDVVAASATVGRMVELSWTVGGETLGRQACDGIICATPTGSTAYNLSNGGPVLVWGLEALAVTFIAPHSLHARSMVVPRGLEVVVTNETPDVAATVLFDGRRLGEIPPAGSVGIRLGDRRSLLATLPDVTFFRRYRQTFTA